MTRKFELVPSKIVELEIPENLPNFDIVVHDYGEDESWFDKAIKHLEEEE